MKKKAFVLLSGGVDSTTCLAVAYEAFNGNVEAISIDYGQRHVKEIECARSICDHYGINHGTIDLRGVMSGASVMLTDRSVDVPDISYDEIKGVSPTYVPFRNGTMLAALAAHAQKYVNEQIAEYADKHRSDHVGGATQEDVEKATAMAKDLVGIYFGAHAEDANNWAYPDCTPEFVGAMANAIYVGTYFTVRLHTPFVNSTKSEIISKGSDLAVPYDLTWSCYKGEELHCGTCPTCRSRKQAFEAAGVMDPTSYAN